MYNLRNAPEEVWRVGEAFFFLRAFLKFYLFTNRHLSSSLIIGYNILPYILKGKKEKEREKK